MAEPRPIFFTSIPKCGKNLVYTFCFALGMERYSWGDAPAMLHRAAFERFDGLESYSFPGSAAPNAAEVEGAWRDIDARINDLPANAIAHHHFLPDARLISTLKAAGVSIVFATRDPRDVLLSMLHFARQRQLPTHVHALLEPLSDEDALIFLIEGGGGKLVPFADYFDAYRPWLEEPGAHVLHFEDIVGPRGGGDAGRQIENCRLLMRLANREPDEASFERALGRMFNEKAGTFFRGQIGAWREGFSSDVKRHYERAVGGLATRWGYPE